MTFNEIGTVVQSGDRQIRISNYDDAVWMALNVSGGSTWCVFSKVQAEEIILGLRAVIDAKKV